MEASLAQQPHLKALFTILQLMMLFPCSEGWTLSVLSRQEFTDLKSQKQHHDQVLIQWI